MSVVSYMNVILNLKLLRLKKNLWWKQWLRTKDRNKFYKFRFQRYRHNYDPSFLLRHILRSNRYTASWHRWAKIDKPEPCSSLVEGHAHEGSYLPNGKLLCLWNAKIIETVRSMPEQRMLTCFGRWSVTVWLTSNFNLDGFNQASKSVDNFNIKKQLNPKRVVYFIKEMILFGDLSIS